MYTIKEASRRSGVGIPLIRAWERRYRLVTPTRTASGYRLYDDDAVARLERVRRLTQAGWSASEASRAVIAGTDPTPAIVPARAGPATADELVERFVDAAGAMDLAAVGRILDDMFARASYESVVDDVLMPGLVALGKGWAEGKVDVAAEHAATAAVQRRLAALFEAAAVPGDATAVVGLPPGSRHDLGALAFAVALRRQGVGVLYLGTDVPVDSWSATMREPERRMAVVGVVTDADRPAALEVIEAMQAARPGLLIAAGGHGAQDEDIADTGATVLPEGIRESAAVAARLVREERVP